MLGIAPATSGAATDTFTRTVASGWGTADFGGAWTPESGVSDFSVNGATGSIRLTAGGASRAAFLSETSVDWDASTSVSLDKTPTAQRVALPRAPPRQLQHQQLPPLRALCQRRHHLGQRLTRPPTAPRPRSATRSRWQASTSAPASHSAARSTGTNPTTIRIKAWSGSEPTTWNYTATDSAGPQTAGRAGLRSYTSRGTTNAPLTLTIDNYAANAGSGSAAPSTCRSPTGRSAR